MPFCEECTFENNISISFHLCLSSESKKANAHFKCMNCDSKWNLSIFPFNFRRRCIIVYMGMGRSDIEKLEHRAFAHRHFRQFFLDSTTGKSSLPRVGNTLETMMGSLVDQVGPAMEFVKSHVDFNGHFFKLAFLLILASPTWWNAAGRAEHKFRIFRKVFFGNKYVACYFFAITVFTLSAIRNYVYPCKPSH